MSRMHLSAQFMAAIQDNSKQYFASMTESFKILRLWTQLFKLILKIFLDLSLFQIYKKITEKCLYLSIFQRIKVKTSKSLFKH